MAATLKTLTAVAVDRFEEASLALSGSTETDILIVQPDGQKELAVTVENDAGSANAVETVKLYVKDHANADWILATERTNQVDQQKVGLSVLGNLDVLLPGDSARVHYYPGGVYQFKLTAKSVDATVHSRGWAGV